jgi:hypothetical protein
MTIELSQEQLNKALELAAEYGTYCLETKTTDGDEILLVVPQRKARTRQPKTTAAAPAHAGPVNGPVEAALQRANAAADK